MRRTAWSCKGAGTCTCTVQLVLPMEGLTKQTLWARRWAEGEGVSTANGPDTTRPLSLVVGGVGAGQGRSFQAPQ